MTRQEVLNRLCLLMGEVASATNHASEGPSDCFCGQGGFWSSPGYASNPDDYRNDGYCVEFMERAVRSALQALPNRAPEEGASDDRDD